MDTSPQIQAGGTVAADGALRGLIAELNMAVLESHVRSAPLLEAKWRALGAAARMRLACCPFLLVDAGFARPALWAALPVAGVHDPVPLRKLLANRSSLPIVLQRRVLLLAWHLARANRGSARIALGMSGRCAGVIAGCRLADLEWVAARRPEWIRARWDQHAEVWRIWLNAASEPCPHALERLQLWGLQMLAADVRRHSD
jgi:hypothetical protein